MDSSYKLIPFNKEQIPRADVISMLHAALLPYSPVVNLGERFMRDFYYRILPAENLIFGFVAYVDDEPAGFVSVTEDATGFMPEALKRHWPKVAAATLTSLIASPARIANIWEAWRIMNFRRKVSKAKPHEAEILSIGVLPQFRSREFIRTHQIRISDDLMRCALDELCKRGATAIRAIVDVENAQAQNYYQKHGWVEEAKHVPGWRKPSMQFIWRPQQSPRSYS